MAVQPKEQESSGSPLWAPAQEKIDGALLTQFAKDVGKEGADYQALWRWSVEEPEVFWDALWDFCGMIGEKGDVVLADDTMEPGAKFFPNGKVNFAENCLRKRDRDTAIIFRDETGTERTLTFQDLYDQVSLWQQALIKAGVERGDRVAGFMPNMPETIIACLAVSSLGGIWSSASPDFGTQGVLDRFGQICPKILIAVDGYYYNGKVIDCLPKLEDIIPQIEGLTKTVIVPFAKRDGSALPCKEDVQPTANWIMENKASREAGSSSLRGASSSRGTDLGGASCSRGVDSKEVSSSRGTDSGGISCSRGVDSRGVSPSRGVDGAGADVGKAADDGKAGPSESGQHTPQGSHGATCGVVMAEWFLDEFEPGDIEFTRVEFNHPLFIMFSSGTTGVPKCIVHGVGGTLIQHLKEHQLQCDIKPGDQVFYFTTCGWMMWNWLITALASEATLLLFDGSPFYPDGYALWDYAEKHGCTLFGTSAKYIDALKVNDVIPKDKHDLSTVRTMTSTGSPLVHESFDFVYSAIKEDLHLASISGGTDIVSCFMLGNPISSVWRGELQGPGLGLAVDVLDEDGTPTRESSGELACTKPFPCMPVMFWNDADGAKYKAAYFERFENIWVHGDWVEKTSHGGFIIHGRSDATLNPGGVRIGTAEIYRQVEQVPQVVESIAVGQDWEGDVRIILFVVLKDGESLNEDLIKDIKTRIRAGASPRHVPAKVIQVTDIPRTKSGKITELAVRDVIMGRKVKNVEALANPEALDLYEGLEELQS